MKHIQDVILKGKNTFHLHDAIFIDKNDLEDDDLSNIKEFLESHNLKAEAEDLETGELLMK